MIKKYKKSDGKPGVRSTAGVSKKILNALKGIAEDLRGEMNRRGSSITWTFDSPKIAQEFVRDAEPLSVRLGHSGPFSVVLYASKTIGATLDEIAEDLEPIDATLAAEVDETTQELIDSGRFDASVLYPTNDDLDDMLEETGFDLINKRNKDVAEELTNEDPSPLPYQNLNT